MVEIEHPRARHGPPGRASPLRLGDEPPLARAPFRGEHTEAVLVELCGYAPERLAELAAAGVFGDEYSITEATSADDSPPSNRATEVEAEVDPEVTPPAVTIAAVVHDTAVADELDVREALGEGANHRWCVVARRPSSSPAAPSRKAPVQTEVMSGVSRRAASQAWTGAAEASSRVPDRPGRRSGQPSARC